jgi:hypothetical protein
MLSFHRNLKQTVFILFTVCVALVTLILLTHFHTNKSNTLFIQEVSFSNNDKQDWVKIYNPSMNSISLKGYYLSDDLDDPFRFQIPFDLVIPAHGSALLHGKKSDHLAIDSVKLNFSLSNGETLILTHPNEQQLDRITLVAPLDYKGKFTIGRETKTPDKTEIFYSNGSSNVAGME